MHSDWGALWLHVFQVDSSETLSDSDAEGKALTEVHSIGVQVEDDKRYRKYDSKPNENQSKKYLSLKSLFKLVRVYFA